MHALHGMRSITINKATNNWVDGAACLIVWWTLYLVDGVLAGAAAVCPDDSSAVVWTTH